ncbi:type II toxin-antitoxin system VapC family toxin [Microbacterium sp. NIBRBAC000506063]|uniref:type II toxin-antitoxin system VapC family toxin n=1 Tax=Microbacterium sp. NIBRBAC000506063 TaxID=2734618 RepID=UPI001BB7D538|nr:type II toxin-antitoxin system VapC family toxin [Microbacterium sp. NIBRBAC000506063]QTV80288.1 type II toxin-antitoxin system VapC family toxin [Microbacterium sp. NIBRBAC000506063]
MQISYVDTSAAMKLLFDEAESEAAIAHFIESTDRTFVSSWLLHTELHCAAGRRSDLTAEALTAILGMIDLADLTRGDLIAAGTLAPLRSNDAIHLAVAMRLGADEIVTYDLELTDAAARAGFRVSAPGA